MATGDIPHISTSNYASATYVPGLTHFGAAGTNLNDLDVAWQQDTSALRDKHERRVQMAHLIGRPVASPQVENDVAEAKTRFVRVLIVDPNENITLEDRLIYSGKEKLTDLTDQELFFELDIRDLLAKHNEKRVKVVDKTIKERTQYLEPAKIRDLRMVVTTIASF